MTTILSPITLKDSTTIEMTIDVNRIIIEYDKMGLDVRRFFKNQSHIEIRRCTKTGYRFYYPFSIFGDDLFYTGLQNKDPDYYPQKKWEHTSALRFIDSGQEILEIGCATGYFLSLCKEKGASVKGLEMNLKAVKDAQECGYDVTSESLEQHQISHSEKYDVVCSFQVLEHISDVHSYFKNAIKCLKPGGLIIIGVPNNNPYIYKHDIFHTLNLPPHHAGLWNKESLKETALFFNLETIFLKPSLLENTKDWYLAQKAYYKIKSPFLFTLMGLIPRPVYKLGVKSMASFIEGKTILGIFNKK